MAGWPGRAITSIMLASTGLINLSQKETLRPPRMISLISPESLATTDLKKRTKRKGCVRVRATTASKKLKMTSYLCVTKNLLKKRVINSGQSLVTWPTSFFKIFQKVSSETCSPSLTRSSPLRRRNPSTTRCPCTSNFTKTLK